MISEKLDLMYAEIRKATNAAKDITSKIEALIDAHLQFIEKHRFLPVIYKRRKCCFIGSYDIAAPKNH